MTPKQYMMIVDDVGMALISRVIPGIKYVEVSSMDMSSPTHQVLVVPKVIPTPDGVPQEPKVEVLPQEPKVE